MLSLRLSMFLKEVQGVEFSSYRNLNSALPVEKDSEFDFVIVGSYLEDFDDTARVSEIKQVWKGAKTKIILIADLQDPKQKICQRTVVNDVVYLFWHFRNRNDIRNLVNDSLRPELTFDVEAEAPKDSAPIRKQASTKIGALVPKVESPAFSESKPFSEEMFLALEPKTDSLIRNETQLVNTTEVQRLRNTVLGLSNLERLKPAIVVIASSTGGFAALRRVVATLPKEFRAPIVIAQHMPKGFEETLVKSLNSSNEKMTVELASDGILQPKHIYVIPYDYHGVLIEEGKELHLKLNQDAKEHSLRPAADPLFRSVSKIRTHRVVAAILTGMGSDGTLGGKEIKDRGGIVICQDQKTSAVWGMPRMAVEGGICDKIVSLSDIGPTLFALTR